MIRCFSTGVLALMIWLAASAGWASQASSAGEGAVVTKIIGRSAADRAGLRVGDVLLAWWHQSDDAREAGKITSPFDAHLLALQVMPIASVTVRLRRGDALLELTLPPGSFGLELAPVLDSDHAAEYAHAMVPATDVDTAVETLDRLVESMHPNDCAAAAWLWHQSAALLYGAQRRDAAEPRQQRAVDTVCGPRAALARAWLVGRAGDHLWRAGDYETSASEHRRALASWSELVPDGLAVAHALTRLGMVKGYNGEFEVSSDYCHQARTMYEKLAPGSLAHAETFHHLGNNAFERDKLDLAYRHHSEALKIRSAVEPGGIDEGRSQATLGTVAWRRDQLERAARHMRVALLIYEELQPDGNLFAQASTMLGHIASARWELDAAERYYLRALEIHESVAPYAVPTTLQGLGMVQRKRKNTEAAAVSLTRVKEIYEQQGNKSSLSHVLHSLGKLAVEEEQYDEAERRYLQALRIRRELGPDGYLVAEQLNDLGRVATLKRGFEQADRYYVEAKRILEQVAPDGLQLTRLLTNLGELMLHWSGRDAQAEAYLERAVAIAQRVAPGTLFEAEPFYLLGRLAERRQQPERALEHFERALTAFEVQRLLVGGSDDVRSRFGERYKHFYLGYIETLLEQGQPEGAFHVLERYRARVLLSLWAERSPTPVEIPAELREEQLRIYRAYDRAIDALGQVDNAPREDVAKLVQQLDELRERRVRVAARVRAGAPQLAAIEYPVPISLAQTGSLLEENTVLLSYLVSSRSSFLFAVRGASVEGSTPRLSVRELPVGREALREEVEALRALIRVPEAPGDVFQGLWKQSHTLHELLVAPVGELLEGAERLLILPDGPLHFLPFAALATNSTGEERQPRYLVERFAIHASVSATTYATVREQAAPVSQSAGERPVVVFGEPQPPDDQRHLAPLAGSRAEARAIASLFAGVSHLYLGAEATETQAKSLVPAVRYAHFAAHAILDPNHPLDSHLVLAAEPDAEEPSNGLLQAWEIVEDMDLDADLVTLSGCETQLGRESGGEGLIGLTRAFHYAGARSVLASLWAVSDRSTAELMQNFYTRLREGLARDEALRSAQLAMIRSESSRWSRLLERLGLPGRDRQSHPFYWAAFQLLGAPG